MFKYVKINPLKHDIYCSSCDHLATARYSPFKLDYENNELDVDAVIFKNLKPATCKAHKVDSFNNSHSNLRGGGGGGGFSPDFC